MMMLASQREGSCNRWGVTQTRPRHQKPDTAAEHNEDDDDDSSDDDGDDDDDDDDDDHDHYDYDDDDDGKFFDIILTTMMMPMQIVLRLEIEGNSGKKLTRRHCQRCPGCPPSVKWRLSTFVNFFTFFNYFSQLVPVSTLHK